VTQAGHPNQAQEGREDLLAVFGLGQALALAQEPAFMVRALHDMACRVLPIASTHLAILGTTEARLYSSGGKTPQEGRPVSLSRLRLGLPESRAVWTQRDPLAQAAGQLLEESPAHGVAGPVGDATAPSAYLVFLGGRPFDEDGLALFGRMAELLGESLARWAQTEGARRKSRQVADLFVMLAEEKERLDYVMRSVPVGLLLTDAEGAIALANDAAAQALGLTDVEIRERRIFRSRPQGKEILGLVQKARAEAKVVSTPYQMEGRWFQLQVMPWPGGAQYLVVTQDIQEWHQLNRLKEDLISIISHEIKNPLTAVINASHLLASGRTGALSESGARMSELVRENALKIRALLDDVVRLSRVYQLRDSQEPVVLSRVLRSLRDGYQDTLQGKLIRWREDFKDIPVRGDARMLENLFTNLMGNAIKYTGIGGHIGVRLWEEDRWARFRVCDDGPGIPAKEIDRIFSPFFRASNVRDQVAGTGLGLVIARNVAESLGGRLSLTSPAAPEDFEFMGCPDSRQPGTAFQVDLPIARP
jgi:PAS domain S-box-containing protein